jgi:hypothetical protein
MNLKKGPLGVRIDDNHVSLHALGVSKPIDN